MGIIHLKQGRHLAFHETASELISLAASLRRGNTGK